jgi:hypothetical protein
MKDDRLFSLSYAVRWPAIGKTTRILFFLAHLSTVRVTAALLPIFLINLSNSITTEVECTETVVTAPRQPDYNSPNQLSQNFVFCLLFQQTCGY